MITSVLSEEQIGLISDKSMAILDRIGVVVPHEDMLNRFDDAGAKVDRTTQRVRIPSELVHQLLESACKQFTIYGRDISKYAEFGNGKRNYNSTSGQANWLDEVGHERRYANMNDVAVATRFADALECINIPGAMADPHEVPISYRCVEVMETMLHNTTKPITFWFYDRASAKYLVDMTIALRGTIEDAIKYPVCYPFLEPISPLRFPFDGIDLLYETARLNLPVPVGPMAQMGLSAPATVAGTMAVENAEILAGICITQLIKPGMPVCYGGICHAFDMRTTQLIFSGPEQAIFGVAMAQMGKYYGLPVYINAGLTDSKRPDAQAGLEAGINLALGVAAGADIYGHMGISGVDQASSLDMLVMQNEVISYVESSARTLDLSDEAFGIEVVKEVGPGGSFIDREHTGEYFRQELYFPHLLDRDYYEVWHKSGASDMETRCRDRKHTILSHNEVEPIREDTAKAIHEVVESAKKKLG
jgi:trimethylamine--corrinoid protein Co-methyltransferase